MADVMSQVIQLRRLQDAQRQQAAEQEYRARGLQVQEARRLQQERLQQENQRRLWEGMRQDRELADRRMGLSERAMNQRWELSERAAEARAQAAAAAAKEAARGKLKPGFAWDPADPTRQVPVPGGPAWRELSSKHADDLGRLQAFGDIADTSTATIERVLDPKRRSSGFNPNFGGWNALAAQHMPSAVPGFEQTQNVKNDLENLKSNLKAQGANLMRGAGGTPGSITEREWPILEKMIESLSPLMGEKEAEEALGRIGQRFTGMKLRSASNYKQEWGDSPFVVEDPFGATRIKNAADYEKLPPGARYVDPNGVTRTKGKQ